jgi:hypothetical protein
MSPPNDPHHRPAKPIAVGGDQLPASESPPVDTPSDQASWSYTGRIERGRVRHFSGHVTHLGGAAGERLRGELAAVISELLRWAATTSNAAEEPSDHHEDTAA